MKIVYIILLNISENFEGNVNFENLKGRSNDAICFKTFGVHVFVAIYHYYDYIFLMKMMPGSPFNDAKLGAEQKAILNEKYGLNDGCHSISSLFKECRNWRLWVFIPVS